MKKRMLLVFFVSFLYTQFLLAQNVGVGTTTPIGKLHIKGSNNIGQLVIDANAVQENFNPLIRLRSNTGQDLLWIHSDEETNTFVGINTGRINNGDGPGLEGKHNTFIGSNSGYFNANGSSNTAAGYFALGTNISGASNVAIGAEALRFNTIGVDNTAVGAYALRGNTNGFNNIAIGGYSLGFNTSGSNNISIGTQALFNNETGSFNLAIGPDALKGNLSGQSNIVYGNAALERNVTGNFNTALGFSALHTTTASEYNTAVGYGAGASFNLGYNNTFLGANCGVNQNDLFNCVVIGKEAIATASSQARIGNISTNSIGGFANWTNFSDGRYKMNVKQDVQGIDFIMKLRPVTYQLNISGLNQRLKGNVSTNKDDAKAIADKEKEIVSGFVAQEVEQAAKETGYAFSGVDKPKNDKDFYGLRYAEFVVPLVKGMQEQQAMIDQLRKEILELKKIIASIK